MSLMKALHRFWSSSPPSLMCVNKTIRGPLARKRKLPWLPGSTRLSPPNHSHYWRAAPSRSSSSLCAYDNPYSQGRASEGLQSCYKVFSLETTAILLIYIWIRQPEACIIRKYVGTTASKWSHWAVARLLKDTWILLEWGNLNLAKKPKNAGHLNNTHQTLHSNICDMLDVTGGDNKSWQLTMYPKQCSPHVYKADITVFTFQMRKLRLSEVKHLPQVNWKAEDSSAYCWAQDLRLRQCLSTHMTDTLDATILCGGGCFVRWQMCGIPLVSPHRCQWHPALWQVMAVRKYPPTMPHVS